MNGEKENLTTEKTQSFSISSAPEILNRKQVSRLLQIGISTLDNCITVEELPRLKLGRNVRFLRSDVEAYLLRNRVTGDNNG